MFLHYKRIMSVVVICCILLGFEECTVCQAATYTYRGDRSITDGFTPPENATIIYTTSSSGKAYTKIANRIEELYVGNHHRFTVAANNRDRVEVYWFSSNPKVAGINKKTGELTAYTAGKTTITLWDKANKTKQRYELTIKVKPVLPEVPKEWYDVEEIQYRGIQGVRLVFRSEYSFLFEQCSMLRIPDYIDGKKVLFIRDSKSEPDLGYLDGRSYFDFGFHNLKMLQCNSHLTILPYSAKDQIEKCFLYDEEMIMSVRTSCLDVLSIPESTKVICTKAFVGSSRNVRIPQNVKILVDGVYEGVYYGGISLGGCYYIVDGNNTNYYSMFGVLFAYPFYDDKGYRSIGIDSNNYIANIPGKLTLLGYPPNKTGSTYWVPNGVERIEARAFRSSCHLKKIILPDSVTELGAGAFMWMKQNVEIVIPESVTVFEKNTHFNEGPFGSLYEDEVPQNITIITPKGSAAEEYAKKYKIKYRNE